MPKQPDKIITNNGGARAYYHAIVGYFLGIFAAHKAGKKVAKEIHKNGWSNDPEALAILADQESHCNALHAACKRMVAAVKKYLDAQLSRNERMRLFVDKKLDEKQQ